MKENWTNNLGMKILSLVFAAILWIVIVNIADPVKTSTFYDVPVRKLNESAIFSLEQVYEVTSGNEVNVTVKGKKSIIDSIQKSDLDATADLSEMSKTLAVNIEVRLTKSVGGPVELSLGKVKTLKLTLEDKKSKSFKVTVLPKGAVEDGYMIGKATAKPNMITVSGAESQIEKIAQIGVEADVSNASEDVKAEGVPKAYDKDGNLLDSDKFQFSLEKVDVTIRLLKTKDVALNITTTGEPYYGYQFINMEYEPKKVTIAGNADEIANIYSIPITIDITNATDSLEHEIDLVEKLPDKTILNDENTTVTVRVNIERLQERTVAIPLDQIELLNLPDNLELTFVTEQEPIVKIMGLEDDIKNITAKDLQPYLELKDLRAGRRTVSLEFASEETKINISNTASVVIDLIKKAAIPPLEEQPNNNNENGDNNENIVNNEDNGSNTENESTVNPEENKPEETEEPVGDDNVDEPEEEEEDSEPVAEGAEEEQ